MAMGGFAPRAARKLMQQLVGAFGYAKVAAIQAQIGIDYPNQAKFGEVMPLRDQLRANEQGRVTRNRGGKAFIIGVVVTT